MVRLFHSILVCIFVVAGASPVSACYATKPNCEKKVHAACHVSGNSLNQGDKKISCPFAELSRQEQESAVPYPAERLKRLKIEQIQLAGFDLPVFTPTLISKIIIVTKTDSPIHNPVFDRHNHPLHPPPQLYLQLQSFLI